MLAGLASCVVHALVQPLHSALAVDVAPPVDANGTITASSRVPVFYAGFQKDGTSSFAGFLAELGYPTIHGIGTGFGGGVDVYPSGWAGCESTTQMSGPFPAYDRIMGEMDPNRRAAFATMLRESVDRFPFAAADVLCRASHSAWLYALTTQRVHSSHCSVSARCVWYSNCGR